MERQKIFWVVLSVSVFVVVVLVVGAFLLRPRPTSGEGPVAVSPLSDQGTQVYEYQVPAGTPGASDAAGGANGATASSGQGGSTETLHFYIGEGQGDAGSTPAPSTLPPTIPSSGSGAAESPPAESPGAASQVASAPRATPAPRTAPAAAAAARPPARTTQYWIQTGSYKSQTRAEDLAALLGDKGLAGRVFSYDVQGATWFRVRVGPYTSKGEADRFLAEVKKLQGLGASYVSQVGPTKQGVN